MSESIAKRTNALKISSDGKELHALFTAVLADLTTLRNLFANTLRAEATKDYGSIAAGAEAAEDITVTGAALGDLVQVSLGVDVVDLSVTAQVTAADTVTVVLANNTGGAVDLASTTVTVVVYPQAFDAPAALQLVV